MRDHGEPIGRGAEVHHGEDLARDGVVEDVLVAADALGRAQGARGQPVGLRGIGERGVGVVVVGGPVRGGEEVAHEGELGGTGVEFGAEAQVVWAASWRRLWEGETQDDEA